MLKIVRKLFLAIMITLGIASLLATPAPLPKPSELRVKTRNPIGPPVYYNSLFSKSHPTHTLKTNFACKGDKITVGWDIVDSGTAILTSLPKTSISPDFDQLAVSAKGSQEAVISNKVTLILASEATYRQNIELLPEEICTGYPITVVGEYEGSFQETSPDAKALKRYLYFDWESYSNDKSGRLFAKIFETKPEKADDYRYTFSLDCELLTDSKQITCKNSRLEMLIRVSDSGLSGEYSTEKSKSESSRKDDIVGTGNFSFSPIP